MKIFRVLTPLGEMALGEEGGKISRLWLRAQDAPKAEPDSPTPLLRQAARQLEEYFAARRKVFDLPLNPQGTPFQQKVWRALCAVPYGQTASYGRIAAAVGSPKACRAVGMANHANPIAIFIPCHRIIGSDGSLTGYGGGLDIKRALLALEAIHR